MSARLRYFSIIGDPTGFAYLDRIADSSHGVSIAPIGPCFLTSPPWDRVAKLFAKPTAPLDEIVNIVCSPRGALLGARSATYEPRTALSELYTPGVPNIAIVAAGGTGTGDEEALARYDLVVVPSDKACAVLTDAGITSHVVPPQDFPNEVELLLPKRKKEETQDARIVDEVYL